MSTIQFGAIYGIKSPWAINGQSRLDKKEWLEDRTPVVSKLQAMAEAQGIALTTDMEGDTRQSPLAACIAFNEDPARTDRLLSAVCNSRSLLIFTDEDKALFERFAAASETALQIYQKRLEREGNMAEKLLSPVEKLLNRVEKWSPKARQVLGSILWACSVPIALPMQWADDADYSRRNRELQEAWGPFLRRLPDYSQLLPLDAVETALNENRFNVRTGAITPPGE